MLGQRMWGAPGRRGECREELGLQRQRGGGRGRQAGEGAPRELPQVSCQKLNHKKAGGEQQGEDREKRGGEGGRRPNSPSTPIARRGDVSNTWLVQRQ